MRQTVLWQWNQMAYNTPAFRMFHTGLDIDHLNTHKVLMLYTCSHIHSSQTAVLALHPKHPTCHQETAHFACCLQPAAQSYTLLDFPRLVVDNSIYQRPGKGRCHQWGSSVPCDSILEYTLWKGLIETKQKRQWAISLMGREVMRV